MKKYNLSKYYYLSSSKVIDQKDINEGATKFDDNWICNYNESNSININKNNKISIYIPSTINVNEINENFKEIIKDVKQRINAPTATYDTQGAWKAADGNIVYENITILTTETTEENFINKLNSFISIAEELKISLSQEAVSIGINDGLLII